MIDLRTQTFGVEIEMAGITRKRQPELLQGILIQSRVTAVEATMHTSQKIQREGHGRQ